MTKKIKLTDWFDTISFLDTKSEDIKVFRDNETSKHTFVFSENENVDGHKVILDFEYTGIENDDDIYGRGGKSFIYTCSLSLEDKKPYMVFTVKSGEYKGFDMGEYIEKNIENYIFKKPYKKVISLNHSEYSSEVMYLNEKTKKHTSCFLENDKFDQKVSGFHQLDKDVIEFENSVQGYEEFKKTALTVKFNGKSFVNNFVEMLKYNDYKKVTKKKALEAIMDEDNRMFMLGETPDSIFDTLARENMCSSYENLFGED